RVLCEKGYRPGCADRIDQNRFLVLISRFIQRYLDHRVTHTFRKFRIQLADSGSQIKPKKSHIDESIELYVHIPGTIPGTTPDFLHAPHGSYRRFQRHAYLPFQLFRRYSISGIGHSQILTISARQILYIESGDECKTRQSDKKREKNYFPGVFHGVYGIISFSTSNKSAESTSRWQRCPRLPLRSPQRPAGFAIRHPVPH